MFIQVVIKDGLVKYEKRLLFSLYQNIYGVYMSVCMVK